ncbi:hypothetical protein [Labilibaculum sp.]|uniref:hypothetical protein n=1 Tax=Labilibaculum sp. TaxID=2060723 RepID=UPI00356B47CC
MNSSSKTYLFILLIAQLLLGSGFSRAQTYPCYLYGNIITVDGDVYKGAIRWGNEEVFLTDLFNAEKEENPYLKYLTDAKEKVEKRKTTKTKIRSQLQFSYNQKENGQGMYDRKFQCRFGDIKSISVTGDESLSLELKNGKYINLVGGSNDVGTQVWVIDQELGLLKIDWERIDVLHFENAPEKTENFGEPIYGKLTTTKGEFTGFIQWDHDERLLGDKLDGRGRDGELSVPFTKIKSIEKTENGSRVTLLSDRNFELTGENDVNQYNRGIVVSIPNVGRIDFPWSHFLSLEIDPCPANSIDCLSEFGESSRLKGIVHTKEGASFQGIIVYDLDQAMDSELLNGLNDELEFFLPFRNVRSIKPIAHNYCLVELRNELNLYLGDKSDVSNKNAGIIVFVKEGEYHVFNWSDIDRIEFL